MTHHEITQGIATGNCQDHQRFIQHQIDLLEATVNERDLNQFGGYEIPDYAALGAADKWQVLIVTRTNKLFVEGVLKIVAGRTSAADLSQHETYRLIEMASQPGESNFHGTHGDI
jgi:hypothetical protein